MEKEEGEKNRMLTLCRHLISVSDSLHVVHVSGEHEVGSISMWVASVLGTLHVHGRPRLLSKYCRNMKIEVTYHISQ